MGTPSMSRTDDVFVIDVGDDENMTSVAWVAVSAFVCRTNDAQG